MNINELRDKQLQLKIEKADTMADIARVNETLARHLQPDELTAARVEKTELSADMASIDVELARTSASIEKLVHSERIRDQRLHNIRLITCALLSQGTPMEVCVNDARKIEDHIQSLEPLPSITIKIDDDE